MPDERHRLEWTDDLESECAVLDEFGYALATAAELVLGYRGRMQALSTQTERDELRAETRGFVRRLIGAKTIAIAALGEWPGTVDKGEP